MKPGDRVEVFVPRWLAERNGIGTLISGTILNRTDKAIRIDAVSVMRRPPSGDDGAVPCRFCNRPLTEEASISLGYGPDCAVQHLGFGNKQIRDLKRALTRKELQAAEAATRQTLWLPLSSIKIVPFGTSALKEAEVRAEQERRRRELVAQVKDQAVAVADSMRHEEVTTDPLPIPLPLDCEPRPYQWRGARFMADAKRAFNWDLMGLGKTIQGILFMMEATRRLADEGRDGPCVVICPPVMVKTWVREIEKWWQGVRVQALKGWSAKINPKAHVYVMPWSVLSSGWEPKIGPDGRPLTQLVKGKDGKVTRKVVPDTSRVKLSGTARGVLEQSASVIVGDEAHNAKNPDAQRSRAAKLMSLPAAYVALMTGTAVLNRPQELTTQLDIADLLDEHFDGRDRFEVDFCNKQLKDQYIKGGGVRKVFKFEPPTGRQLVELHKRLTPFVIRRRTEDVIKDMPPMTLSRVVVDLDNRAEYDAFEAEIAALPPMARLGKLAQLRQLCGVGKIPSMIEWIENFLECDEKLVVFATHRQVQRALLEHFEKWKPARILGQSEGGSVNRNQKEMDRFQQDPDCLLAVCSTGAAREGITLTAAANLLMTELEWVPGIMDQAWKRVHRIGQKDPVTIWNLAAEDSMDDTLMEKMANKRLISGEILDGQGEVLDEAVIKQAVVEDLVRRVARRRRAKKKEEAA